jgi:hypothetical protein
MNQAILFTG